MLVAGAMADKARKMDRRGPIEGLPGGSAVGLLRSAQVVIPGSWDRVPHRAPHGEPASPSAYVSASLCVSREEIKSLKKKKKISFPPTAKVSKEVAVSTKRKLYFFLKNFLFI